jgi:hypothetical protein
MRIKFRAVNCIPEEVLEQNRRRNTALGLPDVSKHSGASHCLAVVGGGHSIKEHVDELRGWPGEVWAINGAFQWCREHGIEATFYTVDPSTSLTEQCRGAKRAVLASLCSPLLFDAMRGADIEVAQVGEGGLPSYATSAGSSPAIAIVRGHREITFFGCESSFDKQTHLYKNVPTGVEVLIDVSGQQFLSDATLLLQAEFLSEIIRAAPDVFNERSGGLLSALVSEPDYDIIAASREIHRQLALPETRVGA